MRKSTLILMLPIVVFISFGYVVYDIGREIPDYSKMVNEEFKGDIAYDATAYVEKYWRVVGNSGFDSSIYKVVRGLEKFGYVLEEEAEEGDIFTYRIEKRKMEKPTWEPVDAFVKIEGEKEPLLQFSTNRNMIAQNSYSAEVNAEVVYAKSIEALKAMDIKGKIVFTETNLYQTYNTALVEGEALGIITYSNPDYLQPEKNTTSIQFRTIRPDSKNKPWAIVLSYAAKERLKSELEKGEVILDVFIDTKIYESEELTVVANIKGTEKPKEKLVFSAHVQEPGANDNATGVGVALEMASVTANLIKNNRLSLKRTLTFLWGDEIVSTNRYVQEDKERAKNIKWGISLDMVGENTDITGGSFLIEKMPDPSAIWTRGNDKHSEWGGSKMKLSDMRPHYLNDFVINKFMEQGKLANWEVNTNPFEGGSDHTPFLRAEIPAVLFWHFTDQFYHTDNDRLDKVSKTTMKNVGTAALVSAYTLLNSNDATANQVIEEIKTAALSRLDEELKQGKIAIKAGDKKTEQIEIIKAWEDYYIKTVATTEDMVDNIEQIKPAMDIATKAIRKKAEEAIVAL